MDLPCTEKPFWIEYHRAERQREGGREGKGGGGGEEEEEEEEEKERRKAMSSNSVLEGILNKGRERL